MIPTNGLEITSIITEDMITSLRNSKSIYVGYEDVYYWDNSILRGLFRSLYQEVHHKQITGSEVMQVIDMILSSHWDEHWERQTPIPMIYHHIFYRKANPLIRQLNIFVAYQHCDEFEPTFSQPINISGVSYKGLTIPYVEFKPLVSIILLYMHMISMFACR